ncbi:hypothetical protein [Paraglaciecola marina]|nr:hypothetical protein [Paraglaciecola marina]
MSNEKKKRDSEKQEEEQSFLGKLKSILTFPRVLRILLWWLLDDDSSN